MAKHFSFVALNVAPISQNSRTSATIARLRNDLTAAHNAKYLTRQMPFNPRLLNEPLRAKVFYIHRKYDYKDADNISKPLWDSLNDHAYLDDEQIRYLETLKIKVDTSDIKELDTEFMDPHDLQMLDDFIHDPTQERFLFVEVGDFECKQVKFY